MSTKKLTEDELRDLYRHVAGVVPEIWEYCKDAGPHATAAIMMHLVARYITGWSDRDIQKRALTQLFVGIIGTIGDINKGIDPIAEAMKDLPKEWKVSFTDRAIEQMADDGKLGDFVRGSIASIQNAIEQFEAGKFASIDEAMQSVGCVKLDADEEMDAAAEPPKTRH